MQDILANEDMEQVMGDTMFVSSLVADLIKVSEPSIIHADERLI